MIKNILTTLAATALLVLGSVFVITPQSAMAAACGTSFGIRTCFWDGYNFTGAAQATLFNGCVTLNSAMNNKANSLINGSTSFPGQYYDNNNCTAHLKSVTPQVQVPNLGSATNKISSFKMALYP